MASHGDLGVNAPLQTCQQSILWIMMASEINQCSQTFWRTCGSAIISFGPGTLAHQDFELRVGHSAMHQSWTRLKLSRAAGCWSAVGDTAVSRVMGGAPGRNKNSKK